MGDLLAKVLPLALGAAVSPTALAAAVVVMASRTRPVARGAMFVLGFVAVLAVFTFLGLTVLSQATPHVTPTSRRISGTVDLVLGIVLLAFGLRELLLRATPSPGPGPDPAADTRAPKGTGLAAALALGAVLMLTNFTSLVLYLPALQDVHQARTADSTKAVVVAVLFVCTALPVLMPFVGRLVAPGPSGRALARLGAFMTGHKRGVTVVVAGVFGTYLLVRGLGRV
jgi:cytochrome c biogenesis protein CcdA